MLRVEAVGADFVHKGYYTSLQSNGNFQEGSKHTDVSICSIRK